MTCFNTKLVSRSLLQHLGGVKVTSDDKKPQTPITRSLHSQDTRCCFNVGIGDCTNVTQLGVAGGGGGGGGSVGGTVFSGDAETGTENIKLNVTYNSYAQNLK